MRLLFLFCLVFCHRVWAQESQSSAFAEVRDTIGDYLVPVPIKAKVTTVEETKANAIGAMPPDQYATTGQNPIDHGNVFDTQASYRLLSQDGRSQSIVNPNQNPMHILGFYTNKDHELVCKVATSDGKVGFVREDKLELATDGIRDNTIPEKKSGHTQNVAQNPVQSAPPVQVPPPPMPTPPAPPVKKSPEASSVNLINHANMVLSSSDYRLSPNYCRFMRFVATGDERYRESPTPAEGISSEADYKAGKKGSKNPAYSPDCYKNSAQICAQYQALTGKPPSKHDFVFLKAIMEQESHFDNTAYRCEDWDHKPREWEADKAKWDREANPNQLSKAYNTEYPPAKQWDDFVKGPESAGIPRGNKIREYECSMGPMQILYETASDQLGFTGKPGELMELNTGIYYGIKEVLQKEQRIEHQLNFSPNSDIYSKYSKDELLAFAYNVGSIQKCNFEKCPDKELPQMAEKAKPGHYVSNVDGFINDFNQCANVQKGTFCSDTSGR